HVPGLTIIREHHLLIFTTDTCLFIFAEWCASGIGVILVYPYSPSINRARELIKLMGISCRHAGAQFDPGVVSDFNRLLFIFECCDGKHGAKYFFLENTHFVMAFEERRLNIITVFESTSYVINITSS